MVEPRAGRRRAVRQLPRRRPGAARGDVRAPAPPPRRPLSSVVVVGVAAFGGRGAEDDPTRPPGVGAPADSRADRFGCRPVERVFGGPVLIGSVGRFFAGRVFERSSDDAFAPRVDDGRRRVGRRAKTFGRVRSKVGRGPVLLHLLVLGGAGAPRRRAGARARGPPRGAARVGLRRRGRLRRRAPLGTPPRLEGRGAAPGGPPASPRTPRRTPKQPSAERRVGSGAPLLVAVRVGGDRR